MSCESIIHRIGISGVLEAFQVWAIGCQALMTGPVPYEET